MVMREKDWSGDGVWDGEISRDSSRDREKRSRTFSLEKSFSPRKVERERDRGVMCAYASSSLITAKALFFCTSMSSVGKMSLHLSIIYRPVILLLFLFLLLLLTVVAIVHFCNSFITLVANTTLSTSAVFIGISFAINIYYCKHIHIFLFYHERIYTSLL